MTCQKMLVTTLTLTRTNIIIRIGSVFLNAMDSQVKKKNFSNFFTTSSNHMLVISLDLRVMCVTFSNICLFALCLSRISEL